MPRIRTLDFYGALCACKPDRKVSNDAMSAFSSILDGTESCEKILEDERYLAFMEKKPLKEGHVVVLPKTETDFIFDLSSEELSGLFVFAQRVAQAIRRAIPCKKVGVAVIGIEVRHAHVHLVPLDSGAELNFTLPRREFTPDQFRVTAEKIRAQI